jgi:hypothetical protein
VLHATNAYASHLLPHLSGSRGIVPVLSQISAIEAPADLELKHAGYSADYGAHYWHIRPNAPGQPQLAFIGGERRAAPREQMYDTVDDSGVNPLVRAAHKRELPAAFGEKFAGKDPVMEWVRIFEFT